MKESRTDVLQEVDDCPGVLTVAETARLLRLSRASTYEAIRRGEIPSTRIGRRILISKAKLQTLLREKE
jgi:excisionase family DNA binding protein